MKMSVHSRRDSKDGKRHRRHSSHVTPVSSLSGDHVYHGVDPLTRPEWPTAHENDPSRRRLLPYLSHPEQFPDRILRESNDTILVTDKYPKAQVHLLLLPRWTPHRDIHPHDAFEDPTFLAMIRRELQESLPIAVQRLRNLMFTDLVQDGLDADKANALLGLRDFAKDFQIGIHAHPTQHELHVHIISKDMYHADYSGRHYQSFTTLFLVPIDRYPLPANDMIRDVKFQNANLGKTDLKCWRCNVRFDDVRSDWAEMCKHLKFEWKSWISQGVDELVQGDDGVWKWRIS